MRWLLLTLPLLLSACPPDLCDRACTSITDQCVDEEQTYNDCTTECIEAGTWRTTYVECVEAASGCTQIGLCPQ